MTQENTWQEIQRRYGEIQEDPIMSDQPDFKLQGMPLGNKLYDVERKSGRFKFSQQ